MLRLITLKRRIVEGVKKNMVAILMGVFGMFLPIGVAFLILFFQTIDAGDKTGAIPYLIIAVAFWTAGLFVWNELRKAYAKENKKERAKYEVQLKELKGIRTDIKQSINELINEIRKDRNERNDKKQQ